MTMAQAPHPHHGLDHTEPNLDALGIFYIAFAGVYTIFILAGLVTLFFLRSTHAVRIRSFPVICGTVLSLHFYLLLILLVYPLNGLFKCGWEFWIMNILLPFGIAFFQAGNIRLYSYAREQKDIADRKFLCMAKHSFNWRRPRLSRWWRTASVEKKTYAGIAAGMVAQLILTIILFFGSRKFHRSYGFFAAHVSSGQCRRGTEWIPSVFWQFLWSTVFGPIILLQIRRIRDTHYWALQTRMAVLACLPGTPLWLTFVYASGKTLQKINLWFPASGWFLPGLITMQFVTIFFPLLDVYKLKKLEQKFGRNRDGYADNTLVDGEKPRNPYSMATLELQLGKNPSNLLYWAYTKEFTAENIMFLTSVRDFKRKWAQIAKHGAVLTTLQLRERFEEAALIYFKLVDPQTARMNINIDYRTFNELKEMFKDCHYEAFLDDSSSCSKGSSTLTENIVTPWADFECEERPDSSGSRTSDDGGKLASDSDIDKLYQLPVTEIQSRQDRASVGESIAIPANFSLEVFDRAYEAVKNDVYLNTWVRYEARYSRPRSPSRPRTASLVV